MRLRLDDGFTHHPKVMALGTPARKWTWLEILVYTCRYDSPVLPANIKSAVPGATARFLGDCEALLLLDKTESGQLVVHDWSLYNGSIEDRVRLYLESHPDATANEVQSQIQGRREVVLGIVKRLRDPVPRNPNPDTTGTSLSVPEVVPTALAPAPVKGLEANASPAISEIYDYWREERGKARSTYDKISPGRRAKIAARLREFTPDELRAAIDGVAKDPWDDRARHDDLTIIFRSREQVEKFIDLAASRNGNGALKPIDAARAWLENAGWKYGDHVIIEEAGRRGLDPDERTLLLDLAASLREESTLSYQEVTP